MCGARGGDRLLDVRGAAFRDVGQDVGAPVRHDRFEGRTRLDPLAADHEWDVQPLRRHLLQPCLERGTFG